MNKTGYVVSTSGQKAYIDVRRTSACGDKCSSCGGGCDVPSLRVEAENSVGAKSGDFVELGMSTKAVLKSAFIVYVIPLIMLVVGIVSGIEIAKKIGMKNYESIGLLSGLVLLFVSFIMIRIIDKKIKDNKDLKVEIIKILDM